MKTTIEHKYNIGDKHFDFDDKISKGKIKEFEITKIIINNVNNSNFITYTVYKTDKSAYPVGISRTIQYYIDLFSNKSENRKPNTHFANKTELNEEEICPTIEDCIEKKTSDYKKQLIEKNL